MAFELAAIRSSLTNMRSFPFIKKREGEGLLALHGLHFDLASGELLALDQESGSFHLHALESATFVSAADAQRKAAVAI